MLKNKDIKLLEKIYNHLAYNKDITINDIKRLDVFITECKKAKEKQVIKSNNFNKENVLYHRYINNYCYAKKTNNLENMKKYKQLIEELKEVNKNG